MPGAIRQLAATALAALAAAAPAAAAGPGSLDRSFGGDGRVALGAAGAFVPRAVGVDRRDRIVVGGYLCSPAAGSADGTCLADGDASFRLARLTPDGGLDPEFGDNGFVTTPIGEGRSQALDVVVLPDGGVLAGGVARSGGRDVFALACFKADGSLDPAFGDGGIVLAPVGSAFAALSDVALGQDGTVLAAGQAVDAGGVPRMAVARFTARGDLDPAFGDGGVTLGGHAGFAYGLAVLSLPDRGAVVAGLAGTSADPATYRFGALRVKGTGALDPGFGGDGNAVKRLGSSSSFANAAVRAPGGWLAAGAATLPDGRQAMAVYKARGSGRAARGYGRRGRKLVGMLDGAVANDVILDRRKRALLVGQAARDGGYDFATVRLNAHGSRDRTFGGDGTAFVRWPGFPIARATAGALQGRALITVGVGCVGGTGARCEGGTSRLLVARQLAGADRAAPAIRVSRVPRRTTARRLHGLRVRVGLSERGRLSARLSRGRRVLWSASRREPGRTFLVRVRPPRAALERGGRLRLALRATDESGNSATRRFALRVRE